MIKKSLLNIGVILCISVILIIGPSSQISLNLFEKNTIFHSNNVVKMAYGQNNSDNSSGDEGANNSKESNESSGDEGANNSKESNESSGDEGNNSIFVGDGSTTGNGDGSTTGNGDGSTTGNG
ncbi:MAG TPA: hypothetical protein VFM31_06625, partial [Nitrososphaeraceae archaeon]|nr:hypothetical protein [Nitrososphaeraceae archaeon]